ncbi:hypothetical protein DFQ28_001248 [Apophysomyces sp. BC1034]|nr:hypothetical protein DFQ28_001248 [Apophysomyces sp. BC1034]
MTIIRVEFYPALAARRGLEYYPMNERARACPASGWLDAIEHSDIVAFIVRRSAFSRGNFPSLGANWRRSRAVAHIGLLFDLGNGDDGAEPPSAQAPGQQRRDGCEDDTVPARAHRPATVRDPDRQQPDERDHPGTHDVNRAARITPKIVGATYPEKIALPASFVIKPLITLARPLVWFVNTLANGILFLLHINTKGGRDLRMSNDELRSVVLESSSFMPSKRRSILLNLFDLESISVDDVMVPRRRIEALDFDASFEQLTQQLETCYHNKLVVYQGDIDRVLGMLHVRKTLAALHNQAFERDKLRELLTKPYFVPSGTPVFQQLQFFQENRHRIALVVNEYGEVQGLVTPEDIIEELISEFTTTLPRTASDAAGGWGEQGECIVAGSIPLRELNRRLELKLPLDGPKTLNGLILELLEAIPEGDVSLVAGDTRMEVMQIDNQAIRTVKLFRPARADEADASAPRQDAR